MKKLLAILLVPLILFSASGCADHLNSDISNRVVLQGIGVDYEEGQYTLTIQVFNLSQASSSGAETNKNVTTLYTTRGTTISQAANGIRQFIGKNPMYSHNRVLVVSQAAADTGLRDILDYFIRDYSTRPSIDFAVTAGKASEILSADFGEATIPAEEIANLLETQSKKARVQVMNIVNRYIAPGIDPTAPSLEVVEGEPKDAKGVRISGVAIMQDDRICGYLDSEQAPFLLVLDGNIKQNEINIPMKEFGNVGLYIVDCKSEKDVGLRDGRPYANFNLRLRFDISELQNAPQEMTEEKLENIRQSAEEYIEKTCGQVLEKLTRELKSDVFGIGRAMMMSETAYFKSVTDRWRKVLPMVTTSVTAEVQIRRSGHESVEINA